MEKSKEESSPEIEEISSLLSLLENATLFPTFHFV